MANNRLYIVDPESGEHFLLARSTTESWYVASDPETFVARLNEWFEMKDPKATFGSINGLTTLVLKTEGDLT